MAELKSVVKDTAIYGLSSIVGRFLNYLLVPIYTAKLAAASGGYGVITNIYAYVALVLVVLTCGMETTFFRFANKTEGASRMMCTPPHWASWGAYPCFSWHAYSCFCLRWPGVSAMRSIRSTWA